MKPLPTGISIPTKRLAATLVLLCSICAAQSGTVERKFSQPRAKVEKALKVLEPELAGRLPVLEGFAVPGAIPLAGYKRAFYQASVQLQTSADGATVVRVNAKVTAWYSDPLPAKSGYQVLTSNGRLENDLLDQLTDQLNGAGTVASSATSAKEAKSTANNPGTVRPSIDKSALASAPFSTESIAKSVAAKNAVGKSGAAEVEDNDGGLRAEAAALEEVAKNVAHPDNIVAIKKSGTPIVDSPSLKAKTLFLASMHDEFELLDFTPDWIHVRISGLSRGWIWRNNVEMPGSLPQGEAEGGAGPVAGADMFQISREEDAPFPGDWSPLRGKKVKIVSIEKAGDEAQEVDLAVKLNFAKYALQKGYDEVSKNPGQLFGVVLIFDSADGGMIAATVPSLAQWKSGKISDAALWHQCFFDPPEAFTAPSAPAGQ